MTDMELLEQSPVAGIVVVSLASCLLLLITELVKQFRSSSGSSAKEDKSVHDVAIEVMAGLWGNGQDRIDRLTAAGYDAEEVQDEVNKILKNK